MLINDAQDFVDKNNINYFLETSAKTGFNAKQVFIQAAKELYSEFIDFKGKKSRSQTIESTTLQPFNENIKIPSCLSISSEKEKEVEKPVIIANKKPTNKKKKCC